MTITCFVTADHVSPAYSLDNLEVRVSEYTVHNGPNLFYAVARKLGCGKNYRTPRDAVLGLVRDHACTNIRITGL